MAATRRACRSMTGGGPPAPAAPPPAPLGGPPPPAGGRAGPRPGRALAAAGGTLAVYMGARTLPKVAQALLDAGMSPATPAIAVENATLPQERCIRRTLADIAQAIQEAAVEGPTLTLIGDVVALAEVAPAPQMERHAA